MKYLVPDSGVQTELIRNIEIDWSRLIKMRPFTLAHSTELPKYLLLPEILTLLNYALDANEHLMLSTLWYTGARISECLALRPGVFI